MHHWISTLWMISRIYPHYTHIIDPLFNIHTKRIYIYMMIPSRFDLFFFELVNFPLVMCPLHRGSLVIKNRHMSPEVLTEAKPNSFKVLKLTQTVNTSVRKPIETNGCAESVVIKSTRILKKATSWKMIHLFHDVPNCKALFIGVVRLPHLITGG